MKFLINNQSVEVDLTPHKRKKGLNNIVDSIIKEVKQLTGTPRLTNQENSEWYVQIREQLLK